MSSAVAAPAEQESTRAPVVDKMILAIDKTVRRYGRLSLSNVTEVMEQIEKDGRPCFIP